MMCSFASIARYAAGSEALTRSPERAKPLAACATAFVCQFRAYPKRMRALSLSQRGEYNWKVQTTEKYPACASAASPKGGKRRQPATSQKQPQPRMPTATRSNLL